MDVEAVMEFLSNVTMLQRLPTSSIKKIAQLVLVKQYERGEHVIREGETAHGAYFIYQGEAVSDSVSAKDENQSEYHFQKYDYFGLFAKLHPVDVIASTKLTCLLLPLQHCTLLEPNSSWSGDKNVEDCSLVESILHMESIEVNIFRGITLPDAPKFRHTFGGQLMGQALAAASKTVDCLKLVHSLHVYFLLGGDNNIPIIYEVKRVRDGKSFATRSVNAIQNGCVIFTMLASFHKEEEGFEHQEVTMPCVPDPETLLSMDELRERCSMDPRLPNNYNNRKVAPGFFVPWPAEIRFCEPINSTNQTNLPPRLIYWLRAKGKLSDDQALHRCVITYASDLMFGGVSAYPHRGKGLDISSVSLDHSMWFHRPVRADEWLLFVITSPYSGNDRGFNSGQVFNRKGELLVSLTQEALMREVKVHKNPTHESKL
ncbi:hypothetical protein ACFE04_026636 [Oxalis oulophora]